MEFIQQYLPGHILHISHSLYVAKKLRKHQKTQNFVKEKPITGLFWFLLSNFGGSISLNFFLNKSFPFMSTDYDFLTAVLCWYIVNFFPGDIAFSILESLPVSIVISAMEGARTVTKIISGAEYSFEVYPQSYISAVIAGWLSAYGSCFFYYLESQMHNKAYKFPTDKITFSSKVCFLGSLLYVLERDPHKRIESYSFLVLSQFYIVIFILGLAFLDTLLHFDKMEISFLNSIDRNTSRVLFGEAEDVKKEKEEKKDKKDKDKDTDKKNK